MPSPRHFTFQKRLIAKTCGHPFSPRVGRLGRGHEFDEADAFLAADVIRGERLFARDEEVADEYDLYVFSVSAAS